MARLRVDTTQLKALVLRITAGQNKLLEMTRITLRELSIYIPADFTQTIFNLVYNLYTPQQYVRTMHLAGLTGNVIEDKLTLNRFGSNNYSFNINQQSTGPDGKSWGEKAEKIESGSSRMVGAAFDRPFVNETQEILNQRIFSIAKDFNIRATAIARSM